MKRREVVLGLSALAGMPALLSLSANSVAQSLATIDPLAAKRGDAVQMLRLEMRAMQFSSSAAAVDIDALFDVGGKLYPHRIASFRAGAVSPQSRLFGFSLDQRALAGFRVELCRSGRSMTAAINGGACSAGIESAYRAPLGGLFVLDIDRSGMGAVVSSLNERQSFDDRAWLASRYDQSYMAFSISPVQA